MAELVNEALAQSGASEDAATLASRAGLLLAELTRDEKDGLATEQPAQAAPRALSPAIEQEYRDLFASARIRDAARPELSRVARFVTSNRAKQRYKEVEEDTNVPWFVIAAIHYREANLNFMGHLHNGDPLLLRTIHVPERRPPAPWPAPDLPVAELWRVSARDALRRFVTPGEWTMPKSASFLKATTALAAEITASTRHICGTPRSTTLAGAFLGITFSQPIMSPSRQGSLRSCWR